MPRTLGRGPVPVKNPADLNATGQSGIVPLLGDGAVTEVISVKTGNGLRLSRGVQRRNKMSQSRSRYIESALALATAAVALCGASARAQLAGGHVVAGQATISQSSATSTLIRQTSPSALITWTGFSIPRGSSVTFEQPSASAIALNRVLGGSPSFLLGSLSANGQVWLVNPAGIVVGSGATISAAGVLLSTADIHDADFLAGNYSFSVPGNAGAGIVNKGAITADAGGSVVLAGAHVTNEGLIAASLGTVVVAGASTYAVDFAGDGLLSFAIDSGSSASRTLVNNAGTIAAPGGLVLMTAKTATDVLDNVINTSGIVEATSAANVNGTIVLSAAGGGTDVTGTLDASGKGAGQTGGTVDVLGDSVTLAASARIDVSGDAGGGTALVGGNFHGSGPQQDAATTSVAAGATIDADAITSGNGGTVAVWSQDDTAFNGSITATGGAQAGNGGFVETSGKAGLTVASGTVDTLAPAGQIGTWLLDPANIVVASGVSGAISPSAIDNATSTVLLQAATDITFESPVTVSASGVGITAEAGNSITVAANAPITTNSGSILLSANDPSEPVSGTGSIVISSALTTIPLFTDFYNRPPAGDGITLTVNGGAGTISLGANLLTAGGAISVLGPIILTGNVEIDTIDDEFSSDANIVLAETIDADAAANLRTLSLDAGEGTILIGGDVGRQSMLGATSVVGYGMDVDGSVITSGAQYYEGTAISLKGSLYQAGQDFTVVDDATFAAPAVEVDAQDIWMRSGVDGPAALTLIAGPAQLVSGYSTGNIELGTVGSITPPASLTATAANVIALDGNVITTGAQTYTDRTLYLGGTRYQTSGAPFSQSGATVLGPSPPLSLAEYQEEVDDDEVDSGGAGSTLLALEVATIVLSDPVIDTTGNGTEPAGAAITFAAPGTIDGLAALTLDAGTGGTISVGAIGGVTPVGAVTMSGDEAVLDGNITTEGGSVTINAPVMLDSDVTVDTAGAAITLAGTVDADAAANDRALALIASNTVLQPHSGNVVVSGAVGGATALGSVDFQGAAISVDGSVTTTGAQEYWGTTVALNGAQYHGGGDFTESGDATIGPAGTTISALDISFCCKLDGPGALTLNAGPREPALGPDFDGAYTFAYTGNIVLSTVGSMAPLASLIATAADDIELAGSVTTIGSQSYSDQSLYLVGTRYQTTGDGFTEIGATILGAPPQYFTGETTLSLTLGFNGSVGFVLSDPVIDTTGNGVEPAGAAITFAAPGTIDGLAALTLDAGTGGTISVGAIGGATPVGAVTMQGAEVALGGNISTANSAVTIDAPVVLDADATIDTASSAHGANVTFAGTIDADAAGNARTLAIDAGAGSILLGGDVGEEAALGAVSLTAFGSTEIDGSVITSGAQSYEGSPVTLKGSLYQAGQDFTVIGDAIFAAPATAVTAQDIWMTEGVEGPAALTLAAGPAQLVSGFSTGNIELGHVRSITPPASLTATAANVIALDYNVTTTGAQTYTDQTLYLGGTLYESDGAPFSQSGRTILGPSPALSYAEYESDLDDEDDGDSFGVASIAALAPTISFLSDPMIDTTGNGAEPAGGAITFAAPGTIDGREALTIDGGSAGVVKIGPVGSIAPLGPVTIIGGRIFGGSDIVTSDGDVTIEGTLATDFGAPAPVDPSAMAAIESIIDPSPATPTWFLAPTAAPPLLTILRPPP